MKQRHPRSAQAVKRRIAVATVTRNRPQMLSRLLASYKELKFPADVEVDYLIVENSQAKSLTEIVETFSNLVSGNNVIYLTEPKLGIASARNCALNYAIENGYDLLTFADDDETVDPCWLMELLKERDDHCLDIVGSPVRIEPLDRTLSWWRQKIWEAVNESNQRSEARSIRKRAEGKGHQLKIATGSWMGELNFFRRTGLRFNTSLGLAGGEDWRLYEEARDLGARTGWTPYALAYETVPASRLCLTYYYRRQRDHACIMFKERFQRRPLLSVARLAGSLLVRTYKTALVIGILPFNPKRALLTGVYHIGSSVGFVRGCLGLKSQHYFTTDGH
ncbi:glycosyltransferase [Brucella intermedia]|uniref:glycosyltransferase n=1 Tax=Brucella TaxID=234 RepID=UPI0009465E67|nr:glycosyltransferase [Brucella intermedia]